jgi:hypothetical protein
MFFAIGLKFSIIVTKDNLKHIKQNVKKKTLIIVNDFFKSSDKYGQVLKYNGTIYQILFSRIQKREAWYVSFFHLFALNGQLQL